MNRVLIFLVVLSFLAPPAVESQAIDLVPPSTTNRLHAATGNWIAMLVMGIGYAEANGSSVEEYARYGLERFAPQWGEPGSGTLEMVETLHAELTGMAGSEFEIVEQSPTSLTARYNRPWVWMFGEEGVVWDVTVDDFDKLWSIWLRGLGDYLGLQIEDWIEDGWLYFTISDSGLQESCD